MLNQKELQKYLTHITTTIKEHGGEGLNDLERRLGAKLGEVQDSALKARGDIGSLENSIAQAQKRLGTLHNEHLELVSKAAGFAESLLAMKFGDELDKEKESEEPVAPKKPIGKPKKKSSTRRRK